MKDYDITDYFRIQQKIAPELMEVVEHRYAILRTIYRCQPIGRRSLSRKLDVSERTVRNNLTFLKKRHFISTSSAGTTITNVGKRILRKLDGYIKALRGITHLEEKLEKLLSVKVHIVPGNFNQEQSKEELGRYAADFLKKLISNKDIMAVTGGTSLATMAEMMNPLVKELDITVVPGRGGLGEEVEIQSNTIAAKIANKLGGEYHLLHIPDNLKQETISTLTNEPSIKQILDLGKQADILIHGIGTAQVMADRREMSSKTKQKLKSKNAVGEAFGYYFNQQGDIVYSTTSVGLKLSDLSKIDQVIAIAGGAKKAKAILAVVAQEYQDILITDEAAAKAILDLNNQKQELSKLTKFLF